ncbi:14053_t:CDS:2 [Entrophospora sp. SA101]|nr:6613_t:CDS:2 [Entrophospora sp. SA101]CAJ0903760.1 14053_t:CDS:2 [Entrophospora sp. SA101]
MDEIFKSSILMDGIITNREMLNSVLKKDFELFSEDITTMLNNSMEKNNDDKSKVDLSELKILKEKEKNRIQDLKKKLILEQKEIQSNNIIKEEEEMNSDSKTCENLKTISNKLLAQFAKFSEIYENEIELWTNKEIKNPKEGNDVVFDGHKILEANTKLDKLHGVSFKKKILS